MRGRVSSPVPMVRGGVNFPKCSGLGRGEKRKLFYEGGASSPVLGSSWSATPGPARGGVSSVVKRDGFSKAVRGEANSA